MKNTLEQQLNAILEILFIEYGYQTQWREDKLVVLGKSHFSLNDNTTVIWDGSQFILASTSNEIKLNRNAIDKLFEYAVKVSA